MTTPTPAELQNASSGFASGFGSTGALLGAVIVVAAVMIVLVFSTTAYRWALQSASAFAATVEYAIKGVATAIVAAVFIAPLYALSQTSPGQRALVVKALAVLVVGYVALVVLGVIGDRLWAQLVKQHEEATGNHPLDRLSTEADADD